MKVSVGLLALCLALCSATPGWEEGKEYVYLYESRFGTGVAGDIVTQFSGRGMKGKLHVYYKNNELAVKFSDLKVGEFNSKMRNVLDVMKVDYKDEQSNQVVDRLEKPTWAKYKDGLITESIHETDDHNEHINLKRAVFSLLQVILPTGERDHHYVVNETSIGGDMCETHYLISHRPTDFNHDAEVLNVTKNHYYDNCKHRSHLFFASMNGYRCPHCKESEVSPFRNVGRVYYNIRGNREKYTIERVYANGLITYSPFTSNGETVMSITNQTLFLEKIVDAQYPTAPSGVERHQGLHYLYEDELSYPDNIDLKKNDEHYTDSDREVQEAKTNIPRYIDQLTPDFRHYGHMSQVLDKIMRAVYVLDYDDLDTYFGKYIHIKSDGASAEEKDLRNTLVKMLALVGTGPTVLYTLENIEHGEIPEKLIVEVLAVLPFYAKQPSKTMVERYLKFLKSEVVTKDKKSDVYTAAWLAYGTLLDKACVDDDFNPHPHDSETYMSESMCKPYIEEIVSTCEGTQDEERKSVYVNALINTRSERAWELLTKEVIPTKKYNTFIRSSAMWGLLNYLDHRREDDDEHDRIDEIADVIMPIFADYEEDYILRIYAFDIMLYTNPTSVFMSNLVIMMKYEPSQKLASYVYSSLANIANSTDPCYEELSRHARYVLPYLQRRNYDVFRDSTHRKFSFFNEKYGFGRSTDIVSIASNETLFPRELYVKQSVNMGGYNFDVVETGIIQVRGKMLDNIIASLLGKRDLAGFMEKHSKDNYNLKNHMETYKTKLEDLVREFYVEYFNHEVFISHSSDVMKQDPYITPISDTKFEYRKTKVMSGVQVLYEIPNQIGLLTTLELHTPVTIRVGGTLEVVKTNQQNAGEFEVQLDMAVGADLFVNALMEVWTPTYGSYGYRLNTTAVMKLPLRGSVDIDVFSRELKIKEQVSEEPYDILRYRTYPSTYIRDGKSEMTIDYSDKQIQRQYKWGHNYLGYGFKIEYKYDQNWNDYGSYRNLFTSFFHKSTRYEDYYYFADKWYAGTRGLIDYAILNPTGRPYSLNIRFERATSNPATEYVFHYKTEKTPYYDELKTEGDQYWKRETSKFEIVANGPTKRRWDYEIETLRHWPVRDLKKLKVHYKRSPIPNYDNKQFEICYESEIKTEGLTSIIRNPLQMDHGTKMDYEGVLKVGPDCKGDNKQIKVTGHATPSDEHRSLNKEKLPMYMKCKEDYTRGYEYSYACWLVKKDQGRLGKYVFDVEYSADISPKVKENIYKIYSWFRHTFYDNVQVERIPGNVPENHVRVEVNVSYRHPMMDVHVYRPYETVHYRDLYIPTVLPRYQPVTIVQPFWREYFKRVIGYENPMCFLSGDYVYTFDAVQYKYQLDKCYHIAVSDALTENMVVMFKSVQDSTYSKAMKVVFYDSEVEIKPEGGSLSVTVDGQKVLTDKHVYTKQPKEMELPYVVYEKYNGYVVKSKTYGIKVYFDGRNAKIIVSNLYRGRQRGLCGDLDGERTHEYKDIEHHLMHSPAEFAQSYMTKYGC